VPLVETPQHSLLGAGAQPLPVILDHAAAVEQLPWHHRDPIGRLLIARATVERAVLVPADQALAAYGIRVVW
jgi:PIN domain nuclease of toxin-antitoxin system